MAKPTRDHRDAAWEDTNANIAQMCKLFIGTWHDNPRNNDNSHNDDRYFTQDPH